MARLLFGCVTDSNVKRGRVAGKGCLAAAWDKHQTQAHAAKAGRVF